MTESRRDFLRREFPNSTEVQIAYAMAIIDGLITDNTGGKTPCWNMAELWWNRDRIEYRG